MLKTFACILFAATAAIAGTIPGITTSPANIPTTAGALTLASDGNVWLIDKQKNTVGKWTESGAFTAFPVPTPNATPYALTSGPDGNVWVAELNGNNIARVTTAGAITEFRIPGNMAGGPWQITSGPDGNLWFLEILDTKKVGRLGTDGTFTEFAVPNAQFLATIAPAVDGLWIIDNNAQTLMKLNFDGTVASSTSLPTSAPGAGAAGVTALDGSFWFIHGSNSINKVVSNGTVTEYHVPTANAFPAGITIGGDGNIWFTEYNAGQIGQLIASTATEGGQATINESSVVGQKLADIVFLPAPQSSSGNAIGVTARGAATIVAPPASQADPACAGPAALVRQDTGVTNNVTNVKILAPSHCADLNLFGGGFARNPFLPESLSFSLANGGPDTALNVTVQATVYPAGAVIGAFLFCATGATSCSVTGTQVNCSIASLARSSSCTAAFFMRGVKGIDDTVILGLGASSDLYDQNLMNNTLTLSVGAVDKKNVVVLPPDSNTPVVNNPIPRGPK